MAEQAHQGREADAESEHLGGKGMAQAVRRHPVGTTGPLRRFD